MPGIWEIVLILVITGWVIIPFFQRRDDTIHSSKNNGQLNHKKTTYRPPKDAKSVEFEEADD